MTSARPGVREVSDRRAEVLPGLGVRIVGDPAWLRSRSENTASVASTAPSDTPDSTCSQRRQAPRASATAPLATLRLRGGDVNGDFAGVPSSQLAVFPGTTHFFGLSRTALVLDVVTPLDEDPARPPAVRPRGARRPAQGEPVTQVTDKLLARTITFTVCALAGLCVLDLARSGAPNVLYLGLK